MGKPIAARNKYPFGITGIVVAGAVLLDGTKLTSLRIGKQRSDVVFDLLSSDGLSQYNFMSITDKDKNGLALDKTKSDAQLVDLLAPGTFYIRGIDTSGVDHGFIKKIMLNKVILGDGTALFNWNISAVAPIPVASVSLNKSTTTLAVAGTETLIATVLPANATNTSVTWTTSDATKVTVSNAGVITAVATGTANITVTTVDGSFTAVCAVTVS